MTFVPTLVTNRATQDEKARAWDHLMNSAGDDSEAIMAAWEWLRDTVCEREASEDQ